MRVAMMTKEYPPEIYGGAGVHVTELTAQLKSLCDVDIHCMGAPRDTAAARLPRRRLPTDEARQVIRAARPARIAAPTPGEETSVDDGSSDGTAA